MGAMVNFRGNFFDSFHQTPHGELRNQYYDPFYVKHRKRTTKAQLKVLEQTFETNIRPDAATRKKLGEQLGMTPRSVQVWFQNRRAKIKKMDLKKFQQKENEQNGSKYDIQREDFVNHEGYGGYNNKRLQFEEYKLYPNNNSIMKPLTRQSSASYNNYGYSRQYEDFGYSYQSRYSNPEYTQMHYQYNLPPGQWQHFGQFEDEYYLKKHPKSGDLQYNNESSN